MDDERQRVGVGRHHACTTVWKLEFMIIGALSKYAFFPVALLHILV